MSNNIRIRNIDPQEIIIDGVGTPSGITNVYVNGVDVTVGSKAYVIVPTKLSELTNDEGFITAAEETDPTVPYYVKEITVADINSWNDKQDALVSGTTIKTINGNSILGSGNLLVGTEYTAGTGIDISGTTINNTITSYNDLTDLPSIPTNTSDLVNDSGFITNQVDDLVNYIPSSLLEKILPQVSDSGTELYLDNTVNYNLKFKLDPHEIEQFTTTGKNLFNKDTAETGKIINRDTGNADVSVSYSASDYIPVEEGEDYVWSNFNRWYSAYYDEDKIYTGYPTNTASITIPAGVKYIRLSCQTTNIDIAQFEKGTTATTYEEYTGGIPSPNPDYPQDIHVNSGENSIIINGKNLYDNSVERKSAYPSTVIGTTVTYPSSSATYSFVNCAYLNAGETYTISWNQSSTPASTNTRVGVIVNENDIILESLTTWINSYQYYTITPSNSGYLILATDIYANNIQIEVGSSASDYEEYQEQLYPIDLTDITDLVSINTTWGKYENFIYRNTLDSPFYESYITLNSLQLGNRVYKTVLDSTDNWEYLHDSTFQLELPTDYSSNPYFGSTKTFAVCSHFLDRRLATDDYNDSWILTQSWFIYLHFAPNLNINDLTTFTSWLENNTVTVYAIRGGLQDTNAEPTDIAYFYPGLAEQYNNLTENSTAYAGSTTIRQENDDLPFILEATAFKKVN